MKFMKLFTYVILLIGVCGEKNGGNVEKVADTDFDQNTSSENIQHINIDTNYLGGTVDRIDAKYGKREDPERYDINRFDVGNPDIHGRIQRPCQVYDLFCIRKFFAEHSNCKISGRQVPEPLFRAETTFHIPGKNVSATLLNLQYRGIKDGRVVEFYIDKVIGNLVIALDFDSVTFLSNNVNVKYYHRGREPTVLRDFGGAAFVKLTVTAVIPDLNDLKLDRAEITTYAADNLPPFAVGPGVALSTDPEVLLMFAAVVANLPQDYQETLSTEGVFYASNFIQYNICDFGLKVL